MRPEVSNTTLDPGSAVVACVVAGSIAGSSTVLMFAVSGSPGESWSVAEVVQIVSITSLAAGVGAVVAMLPGVAIGLLLQRFRLTPAGPLVGAVAGALLPLLVLLAVANDPNTNPTRFSAAALMLSLCGALGGGLGGATLAHYGKRSGVS